MLAYLRTIYNDKTSNHKFSVMQDLHKKECELLNSTYDTDEKIIMCKASNISFDVERLNDIKITFDDIMKICDAMMTNDELVSMFFEQLNRQNMNCSIIEYSILEYVSRIVKTDNTFFMLKRIMRTLNIWPNETQNDIIKQLKYENDKLKSEINKLKQHTENNQQTKGETKSVIPENTIQKLVKMSNDETYAEIHHTINFMFNYLSINDGLIRIQYLIQLCDLYDNVEKPKFVNGLLFTYNTNNNESLLYWRSGSCVYKYKLVDACDIGMMKMKDDITRYLKDYLSKL